MAFDWENFAGTFLNTVTEGFQKKAAEAEAYKEKQEAAADRNRQLIQTRQQRAKIAAQLGKQAELYGADRAQIMTAIGSGTDGIAKLVQALEAAHKNSGLPQGTALPKDDIEALINMPNLEQVKLNPMYLDQQMGYEDIARKAFLGEAAPAAEDTGRTIADVLGFKTKRSVKRELAETPYSDGFSIAEINSLARQDEFNEILPNAVMTIGEPKAFNRSQAGKFVSGMRKAYADALDDSDDAAELARRRVYSLYPTVEDQPDNILDIVADAERKARKAYAQDMAAQYIDSSAYTYATEGFFENEKVKTAIETIMEGQPNFYDDLLNAYGFEADEEEEPVTPSEDDSNESEPAEPEQPEEAEQPEEPEESEEPEQPERPVVSPVEPRPGGGRGNSRKQREWDKKYKGKFNTDGTPIMVEPRPADGGPTTGRGRNRQTEAQKWDRKYGKTHNPDGTPKVEE